MSAYVGNVGDARSKISKDNFDKLVSILKESCFTKVYSRGDYPSCEEVYLSVAGYVIVDVFQDNHTFIYVGMFDRESVSKLKSKIEHLVEKVPENKVDNIPRVHVVVQTSSGLDTREFNSVYCKLVRDNYDARVLSQWDNVISEFKKSEPVARMAILNGPPGTGKTHLIKSMLFEDGLFCLLLPNDLFVNVASPAFLNFLINTAGRISQKLVLILEDADSLLEERSNKDDVNPLATLLNMADGILGRILDVRMILTTNRKDQTYDAATLRAGRLLHNINVDKLEKNGVLKAFRNILADNGMSENDIHCELEKFAADRMSIADVYAMAFDVLNKRREAK